MIEFNLLNWRRTKILYRLFSFLSYILLLNIIMFVLGCYIKSYLKTSNQEYFNVVQDLKQSIDHLKKKNCRSKRQYFSDEKNKFDMVYIECINLLSRTKSENITLLNINISDKFIQFSGQGIEVADVVAYHKKLQNNSNLGNPKIQELKENQNGSNKAKFTISFERKKDKL